MFLAYKKIKTVFKALLFVKEFDIHLLHVLHIGVEHSPLWMLHFKKLYWELAIVS